MNRILYGVAILFLMLPGCTSSSRVSLADINPTRRYLTGMHDLIEAVRTQSQRELFRLDSFSEDAGRIVGHKNTSSSARQGREFTISTTAMMIIINVKMKKISADETDLVVNFAFETGHGTITRDEEDDLLDCYHSFLTELDNQFVQVEKGGSR